VHINLVQVRILAESSDSNSCVSESARLGEFDVNGAVSSLTTKTLNLKRMYELLRCVQSDINEMNWTEMK